MSHIEIHGIPEELYTSTNEVVTKLAQKLNAPISTEDIDISHKLYNGKDKPKSIIVKLISHQKKTELYKKRVQLKNVKVSDLFTNSSAAAITQSERLFINENLTRYRKHLAPVPGKPISANRGLNLANPGLKFILRLDSVPESTINTNLGINEGLNLIHLARSINSLIGGKT